MDNNTSIKLKATAFKEDPRIAKAKELFLMALKAHSFAITEKEDPKKELIVSYDELIKNFAQIRGAPLFLPYIGSGLGNSSLVELLDGSVKYDLITGIGVHFFGHSSTLFAESSFDALLEDILMQGNLQQNIEALELGQILTKESGLPHCFLTTSGVMANENAVKIAFQKNHPADRILAFERCFAGRSLSFSQVSDKPAYRDGLPINMKIDYVPFYDPERPEESTELAVRTLKKHIARYPRQHAIMIFELVQGEGGFYVGSKPFFEALMQVCKEHHIAVFADEVQSFARTYELFAYKYFGLEKYVDIAAIGKLSQVSATLYSDNYNPKPLLLAQTFTGSTAAIQAAKNIINYLTTHNFYGKNGRMREIHDRFLKHLHQIQEEHKGLIKGPFGIGAMITFTPFDGTSHHVTDFIKELFKEGVIGFIAGGDPTRVRFLPPAAVITNNEIDTAMEIVKNTLIKMAPKIKASQYAEN